MPDEELLCSLWLAGVLGPANERSGEVLDLYGSPAVLWQARGQEDLSGLLTPAQRRRMQTTSPDEYAPVLEKCRRLGIIVLGWDDENYPEALRFLPDPPVALYATGRVEALAGRSAAAMVGSRRASAYGAQAAAEIGKELARAGVVIVSGLADGLDSEAHKAALAGQGTTVAVLGCAIDTTYPARNATLRAKIEETGLVLSEYAPGTVGAPSFFLQRNRLIAGLSGAVCVLEAREKSGSLNTAQHALRYGKLLFALPGSIFSPISKGTNLLLATGDAKPLLDAACVLTALGVAPAQFADRPKHRTEQALGDTARAVRQQLGAKPVQLGVICQQTGLATAQVLAALTELEIAGMATPLPGRQYLRRE